MAKYNDIDMKNWKEYEDIYTDSLWVIDKRDNSGAHSGKYHGNFIPQILTRCSEGIQRPETGCWIRLWEAVRRS